MITSRSIDAVRRAVYDAKRDGARVAFVPTMGFLHEGHLSLVDLAKKRGARYVVASVYVNPTQFGPTEDFTTYPRDEARDAAMLAARGVDLLFAPETDVLYPEGFSTMVRAGSAAAELEGERRPGHFDGVATIVLKLLNIVQPDLALFGQKDAQQCAVIRQLVRDLDVPVEIVIGPTVRESDGLAMSSRNAYLSPEERAVAPKFHAALAWGAEAIAKGAADVARLEAGMATHLDEAKAFEIDYVSVVDAATFERPVDFNRDLLIVGAVRIGRTRLIDNIPVAREANRAQPAAAANARNEE
ncbi:MAG: pantoate--beta-alanine ligase [Thermoanaerobaculia bacterium]